MKVLVPGHQYKLDFPHSDLTGRLCFRNNGNGSDAPGTSNQEVLRALIDRVIYLDNQVHWHGTGLILSSLRTALVLHESRHLERMTEKGDMLPESVPVGDSGHYDIVGK